MITPLPESCQCLSGCERFSSGTHMAHTIALLWSTVSPERGKPCLEGLHCFIFTFQSCDRSYEWKKKAVLDKQTKAATFELKGSKTWPKHSTCFMKSRPCFSVSLLGSSLLRLWLSLSSLFVNTWQWKQKQTNYTKLQESTHLHEATFWCPEIGNGEVAFDEGGYRRQEHLLELAHE